MEMNGEKPVTKRELDESLKLVRKDLDESLKLVRKDLDESITSVRKDLGESIQLVRKDLNKVAVKVVNLEAKLDVLQATVATKDDIKVLATTMANFAGRVEEYEKKEVGRSAVMDEHGKQIRKHEARLRQLEGGGQDDAGSTPI